MAAWIAARSASVRRGTQRLRRIRGQVLTTALYAELSGTSCAAAAVRHVVPDRMAWRILRRVSVTIAAMQWSLLAADGRTMFRQRMLHRLERRASSRKCGHRMRAHKRQELKRTGP